MSSLGRQRRILRGTIDPGDMFVLADDMRAEFPSASALTSAVDIVRAAEERAADVIAAAEAEGEAWLARAQSEVDAVRRAAYGDGFAAGQAAAASEVEGHLALARRAG